MECYVIPDIDIVCMKANLQYIERKKRQVKKNNTHETILFTKYKETHLTLYHKNFPLALGNM